MDKKRLIIIGAGLSGLYAATLLQEHFDITMIEARERIGGRVLSIDGDDLGPSWVWPHQRHLLALIHTLGLGLIPQYSDGLALYDIPGSLQTFTPPPTPASARIDGGALRLIEALQEKIHPVRLHLGEPVHTIEAKRDHVIVHGEKSTYDAELVICTVPPRLALESIDYLPPLDAKQQTQMQATPTWMGSSVKCVMTYQHAFWRSAGLSGFVFSHQGPLGEIHDACTSEHAALFGFLHSAVGSDGLEAMIIAQMVRLFGDQASSPLSMHIMPWRDEPFTSTRQDRDVLTAHPSYGLDIDHFEGRLHFTGTESAYEEGGYLEGAIISVRRLVSDILQKHLL